MKLNNKQSIILLVFVLCGLSAFIYNDTIKLFPAFIHSWTQSDHYAVALSFLNNGFDFFHPATFNLQTIEGITRMDFPINEYIVALLMKLFGTTSPAVFRIYTLCISIVGLVFLFLLTKKITSSDIKAWFVTLFVFFSPIYVYYQAGFIPSVPAISCMFIGYYYLFLNKEENDKKTFYLAIIFFALAALMRMPFVIFLFAVFIQQAWTSIKNKKLKTYELLSFSIAFILFIGYYLYNAHLSRLYGNMFLDHVLPAKNLNDLKDIIIEMYSHWGFHYFTLWHYLLLLTSLVFTLIAYIKHRSITEQSKQKWIHIFITFCGATFYFLLMARQYYAHDYYFLDSFFVPIIFLLIFSIKSIRIESIDQQVIWSLVFLIGGFLFFISNHKVQAARYSTGAWDRVEITRQNFTGSDKFLDKNGIPKDAKILVIDAYTTNAPLILMNRRGYTVMGTSYKNISTSLFWCKWDYVAIQDVYLVSDVIKNYPLITSMLERVCGTGNVSFYKRSKKMETKTLKQFLAINEASTLYSAKVNYDEAINDTLHIKGANAIESEKYFSAPNASKLDSTIEYGTTIVIKASELKNTTNLKVLVNTMVHENQKLDKIQLVASISSGSTSIFYQSFSLSDYMKPTNKWQHLEFQFALPAFKTPTDELKIYLWNPEKAMLYYDDWEVVIYK